MGNEGGQHRPQRLSMRKEMLEPEEVGRMLALHGLGWRTKRITRELGVGRNMVKRLAMTKGFEEEQGRIRWPLALPLGR